MNSTAAPAAGEPELVNETTNSTSNDTTPDTSLDDDIDLLPTAATTSFDATTPYQILLLSQPPAGIKWYNFCRSHSIDMGGAHLLSREVARNGVAILGTWSRDEARGIERWLREEMGLGDKGVRCLPAPLEGSGVVQVPPKNKGADGTSGGEPDKKKAKTSKEDSKEAANDSARSSREVNPEIQRLYDEGIITSQEFDQMREADQLFEAEVEAAPTTFAVQKFPSSKHQNHQQHLPPALRFDYNNGRRPDVYDAYAHRHDPRFWVNHRLFQANAASLDAVCLVEFCRKYTVPKKGPSEGKIKYHRRGVITKKLQFHPEYSSDPSFEGGKDYGKYCRFALVRYRPWVDAPFGRVLDAASGKEVEHKPQDEECIRRWGQYLLELRERMHLIPDVLLPEELKGGGAGIELLVVPDVEGADEVEQQQRTMNMEGGNMDEDEKKMEEEAASATGTIGGDVGVQIQTLDDVIRAAEEATLAKKAAEAGAEVATNADAAIVSDDDEEKEEEEEEEEIEDDDGEDDVLPSSFTDMGEADVEKETTPDAAVAARDDDEAEDDDNPFASLVSNKMSGDAEEEDTWLSSVMAAGAVAVDAAAERSAKEESEADAFADAVAAADTEEDNASDDASLDSISKMFDDAKKRLSGAMSAEAGDASEAASIAASDDSSQIEEMHNDFSADSADFSRKESDDNMAREEIDLASSISFVKEELDEVDAEAEAAAAATLLQSAWRGHSARKIVPPVSDDTKQLSELEVDAETNDDAKLPVVTPEKAESVPSALAAKLEKTTAISSSKPDESASTSSISTSPRNKTRAPESLPFLAESASSNFVSPRKRELQDLRDMVKGRATEGKERLEAYAGQHADEQFRIEELRSQADADQHKINEIHRQAKKVKTTSSALLIQSAWRRHKAETAFIEQRDAVRERNARKKADAAVVIQSAARGYSDRQRYVAILQGCVALQALARGSQARVSRSTTETDLNVEYFHDAATPEHGDTNLTDEYCPSNASVGDYFTAAGDEDTKSTRKNKAVGPGKKLFGRRKGSKAKGYAEMVASDSESDDEIEEIRQSTSFLGRKSLKADGYYAEMLVDDYASESDVETTASLPKRSNRSASPVKRRVKKMNDKEKDGKRKSVVGSLLRRGKGTKKKSVVADIVDEEDTTGSILLSARVPLTKPKPRPKPKSKKSRTKKNKTRGVRETGAEEPEFWQGFAVDMEESDIESDMEDDSSSFYTSMQRHSNPTIFDCRTIEEEEFDEPEENFFASTTPRAQVDLSKDAVPYDAAAVTTEEFSNYVSNRYEFPEEPLVFNPDNHWQQVDGEKAPSAIAGDNEEDDAGEPAGVEVKASAEDETVEITLPINNDKTQNENVPADNLDEESAFGAGRSIASAVTLKASAPLCIDDENDVNDDNDDKDEPDAAATSRLVPATASSVADSGPGPLTQAAVFDSANIFPMENRQNAALPDEKDPSSVERALKFDTPEKTDAIVPSASGEIEVQVGDSPREVSAGDILVDLETTLKDEDVSAVSTTSGKSRLRSLRRPKKKAKSPKKSKASVQEEEDVDGESLLNTESSGAMNFGQIVPEGEEEDGPSVAAVNVSINTSFDEGVEVSMDSIEPIVQVPKDFPSKSKELPPASAPVPTPMTNIIPDDEEEMPVIAPSTITATRFRVRSMGRTYAASDDVEL